MFKTTSLEEYLAELALFKLIEKEKYIMSNSILIDPSYYVVKNAHLLVELSEIMAYMAPSPSQVLRARIISLEIARNALHVSDYYKRYSALGV